MEKKKYESFNDGLCNICTKDESGEIVPLSSNVRFQERVVGYKRHYTARQAQAEISRLIRIPKTSFQERATEVIIGNKQYHIEQAQLIPDSLPPCINLSLQQLEMQLIYEVF